MVEQAAPWSGLAIDAPVGVAVFRVGYVPDPLAWTPWEFASAGRFDGRWDDPGGVYRTLYVGESVLGCLLEVLADFRPDLTLLSELASIVDNDDTDGAYPTAAAGSVPVSWLAPRRVGAATMTGSFVDVRAARTLATLRPVFAEVALGMGLVDLDAGALKLSAPRTLTQAISAWCYYQVAPPVTGVRFASRFDDGMGMWAVFEQPGDDLAGSSPALSDRHDFPLVAHDAAIARAFAIHGLRWATRPG